jgi:hypothetical protein
VKTAAGVYWELEAFGQQEDESRPPPSWQRQTAQQSVHREGSCSNGVESAPSSSQSRSRFSTLRLLSLCYPEGRALRAPFCGRQRRAGRQRAEELQCFSQEFYGTVKENLRRSSKICDDNGADFVAK